MDRDSGKSNPSRQRQEEDNPFIAFRRYADELMSDLVHTVMGSSSSSSYKNSLRQQREAWDAASKEDSNAEFQQRESRWYNDESRWPESEQHSEKTGDGFADEESDSRSYNIPVKKWKGAYNNGSMDEEERTCPYRRYRVPAHVSRHHDDPELFSSGHFARFWAFSPYSPQRLMQQEQTRNSGPDWIEAFQDLLRHQEAIKNHLPAEEASKSRLDPWGGLDEDEWNTPELPAILRRLTTTAHKMTTSPFRGLASKQPENDNEEDSGGYSEEETQKDDRSGVLELSRLLGSMNMGTRTFKELDLRELEDAPQEDSLTELDLYERALSQKQANVGSQLSKKQTMPQNSNTQSVQKGQLGIVSTLTTTERVTLPDGTVHTKMMLKKRFADGREESSESVHTAYGGSQSQGEVQPVSRTIPKMLESAEPQTNKQSEDEKKSKQKGKGWFWS